MDEPTTARTRLAVAGGAVVVTGNPGDAPARLSWPEHVSVTLNGSAQRGSECRVGPDDVVEVTPRQRDGSVEYDVSVSRDRMEARLTVRLHNGARHTLRDAAETAELELSVNREELPAPVPTEAAAQAAVAEAGVTSGIDREAVKKAVVECGRTVVIATGEPALPGEDGRLEELVEWRSAWRDGVAAGTALIQRIPSVPGTPGRDVTGRDLAPPAVKDPRLRAGHGCDWDGDGVTLVAAIDGSAVYSASDGRLDVNEELVVRSVDTELGDLDFIGSVRVDGNVDQGRRVRAGKDIYIRGNVDRSRIESGGDLRIDGTVMSSELRAGADRAVYAGIIDEIRDIPGWLAEVATRAAELQQAAEARGQQLAFGHGVQVIVERMYGKLLRGLSAAADHLREAGEAHREMAESFARWHRLVRTAANEQLTGEGFGVVVGEVGEAIRRIRSAVEQPSNVSVNYMQAGTIEATGLVTITGKGIFNSRIVAWNGLVAEMPTAVVRGGTIICHGTLQAHAIGSPGGALMKVVLGAQATMKADLVHAGTVVQARYGSHRFIADRADVEIAVDESGLDVQSFAA